MGKQDPTPDAPDSKAEDSGLPGAQKASVAKRAFLSRQLCLRILIVLVALGVTASIFVFRNQVSHLSSYGYLGAFLISLLSSATIILPIPGLALIFALGAAYNPFFIGLAAGAGSALGEITGYMAGYSGQTVLQNNNTYLRMERWMKRRGSIVIFVLAFVPNPIFDLAGAAAGVLRYPLWKFLLVCFLGKTPKSILVALAGAWALEGVLRFIEKYF